MSRVGTTCLHKGWKEWGAKFRGGGGGGGGESGGGGADRNWGFGGDKIGKGDLRSPCAWKDSRICVVEKHAMLSKSQAGCQPQPRFFPPPPYAAVLPRVSDYV